MEASEAYARTQFARAVLHLRFEENRTDDNLRRLIAAAGWARTHRVTIYEPTLTEHWCDYRHPHHCYKPESGDIDRLYAVLERMVGGACFQCKDCRQHSFYNPDMYMEDVCVACQELLYRPCEECDTLTQSDQLWEVNNGAANVCRTCVRENYANCHGCGGYHGTVDMLQVDEYSFCEDCHNDLEYCEHCDERIPGERSEHPCYRNCKCEPAQHDFRFPIEGGASSVASDCMTTVSLPAGTIDANGMGRIARLVHAAHNKDRGHYTEAAYYHILHDMEPLWQTKLGNLPKRISKYLYKEHQFKASPELLAQIGTVAKQHTSEQSDYTVELSRALNEDAEHWYHGDSCWWGGYSHSRCRLKAVGGLGMRLFDANGELTGRVWIIPVDSKLRVTQDAAQAHAYIAFNAYGVDGFATARILAAMTGKSYRKIKFAVDEQDMYVNRGSNGTSGYLIAAQDVCDATERLNLLDMGNDAKHGVMPTREMVAA